MEQDVSANSDSVSDGKSVTHILLSKPVLWCTNSAHIPLVLGISKFASECSQ